MKRRLSMGVLLAGMSLAVLPSAHAQEHEAKSITLPAISSAQDVVNTVAYFQRQVDEKIAANKLDEVHVVAFAASDAAAKAKDYAGSLTEDKRKELDGYLAKIKSISKQLDKYGDAGKATEAKQFAVKLKDESEALQNTLGVTAKADWSPGATGGSTGAADTSGTAQKH